MADHEEHHYGNLNNLASRIHDNAIAHGFWEQRRNFGEMMALIHSEVSEALECHRNNEAPIHYEAGKPEGSAAELIDVMIRALDVLHSQGVDIDAIMHDKVVYNETRPYKHNKAY